jgi:hypothetical protein
MKWICGFTSVAILALAALAAMRGDKDGQSKAMTVVEGPPPGFEQPRYVGWVFGRMMGINSSDYAWPAHPTSSQPTSSVP